MEIIQRRGTGHHTERRHEFEWADCPGAGFTFDVDKDNNIIVTENCKHNVELCLSGDPRLIDKGIIEHEWSYHIPAVGKCDICSRRVTLEHFTNTCICGADYNSSGQRLAPRSQWGEETGESLGDILRIP